MTRVETTVAWRLADRRLPDRIAAAMTEYDRQSSHIVRKMAAIDFPVRIVIDGDRVEWEYSPEVLAALDTYREALDMIRVSVFRAHDLPIETMEAGCSKEGESRGDAEARRFGDEV